MKECGLAKAIADNDADPLRRAGALQHLGELGDARDLETGLAGPHSTAACLE